MAALSNFGLNKILHIVIVWMLDITHVCETAVQSVRS